MSNNTNKYFILTGMLLLSLVGVAAILVIVFYVLKLFAVTMFNIPGSSWFFEIGITAIPYLILFGAYYIVHRKISAAQKNMSAAASRIILTAGSLICILQLVFAVMGFFKVQAEWMNVYNQYNKAGFALHLILILIASGILATGDPAEKNWMERK